MVTDCGLYGLKRWLEGAVGSVGELFVSTRLGEKLRSTMRDRIAPTDGTSATVANRWSVFQVVLLAETDDAKVASVQDAGECLPVAESRLQDEMDRAEGERPLDRALWVPR